jgi:hypothetical protein
MVLVLKTHYGMSQYKQFYRFDQKMASKQDVYLVLEAVRLLSEEVSSLHKKVDSGSELVDEVAGLKGVVAGLAGKLEEVLAGVRGSAEVLQELKAAELRDRLDMLEMKWSVTQMGDVAHKLFTAMKSLEKPEWLLYIEVFGAGFHQPLLAMMLIGAAAFKGNPFWMLLAVFLSFFLSPYLTSLWCFSLLVWRCNWMRRRCMRSTGCGGSPSSKRSSSRNSTRNSSFLSNIGSRLSSLSVFPMPSFASFTAWRSQRTSDTTNGGDVESPQVDASPGEGSGGEIELSDFAAVSSSTPVIIAPSSLNPDPPVSSTLFTFPAFVSRPVESSKEHIV